ncbi:MSF1-domain-containing protein [Metschnikowia bicuspidata var. bicuspidata NRRL YB-4993]|uniref:MSF1-domain-containing protein n=1 Tax=Metschnikowia bicuspidata var. bicuspidata NRRL YB-4993 TaxID=869754 RepID=A0A1A0HCB8_9ASCO|nr:MSF1-domain-containing protein [Metschnikowia bicuspidata var. bicuspidata NRRL YB-4993]OBA21641.1 MSF1-domain-containing protein [Metschnikowia bicuspidata var. bicuspidata NRRL YB-4993]
MKVFESTHYFDYSWEQVTAANWQKYPNELATHVISVDILHREIDVARQTLRTERLIACKQPIPRWLRSIVGGDECSFVREISEVDLVTKKLVMKSANMTMNHLLSVKETVTYRPDPSLEGSRTVFEQEAEITAFSSFKSICNKIEDWSVERFGQNASIGKKGFESVLQTLAEKWDESGVFVKDVGCTLLKEFDEVNDMTHELVHEVTEKTTSVLSEVRKLGMWPRK